MSSSSPTSSRWRQPAPFPPRSGTRDPVTVPTITPTTLPASQLPFPDVIAEVHARSAPTTLSLASAPVTPIISPVSPTEPLVAIPFQTWLQWQQELSSRAPIPPAPDQYQTSLLIYQGTEEMQGEGDRSARSVPGRGRRSQSVPRPPPQDGRQYAPPFPYQQQPPPPSSYPVGQSPYGVSSAPPTYPVYPPAMGNYQQPYHPPNAQRPLWLQHQADPSSTGQPRSSTGTTHLIRGLSSHPRPEVLAPLVSQLKRRRDPAPPPSVPKPSLSTAQRYGWLAQYGAGPSVQDGGQGNQARASSGPRAAHMHLPLGQPPPDFKPYTVTDYQAIRKADAVTRLPTSLGPPTDPESEARRAKAMAAHEYAERLRGMSRRQRSMTM